MRSFETKQDAAREQRLRRKAKRLGLDVHKPYPETRDVEDANPTWTVSDPFDRDGDYPRLLYCGTLDEIERKLDEFADRDYLRKDADGTVWTMPDAV